MAFQDHLHSTPEYQTMTGEQPAADQGQQRQQRTERQPRTASTGGNPLAQVTEMEKGDIEFWLRVATVILLFLIYREMARSNGREAVRALAGAGGSA